MLGENIKKHRIKQGLTQKQLADYVGISGAFMSLIEKGANNPSEENLEKIANVLKVSKDDLLADEYLSPTSKLVNLLSDLTELGKIKWEINSNFDPTVYTTKVKDNYYDFFFCEFRTIESRDYSGTLIVINEEDEIRPVNEKEYKAFELLNNSIEAYFQNGEQIFQSINDLESLLNED